MAKQSPEMARLLDGVRAALVERGRVAELARTINDQVAAAEAKLVEAHAELDRFLVGDVLQLVPDAEVSAVGVPLVEDESEVAVLRRKVAAGLVDEAPCDSGRVHDPHQWDDELGAVVCLGVQPVAADG